MHRRRPDRGIDAFVEEPLSERHRGVLAARIVVRNQAVQVGVAFLCAGEEGVLDRVEDQRGGHRFGCTPAHDPATEGVDDERDVDNPVQVGT